MNLKRKSTKNPEVGLICSIKPEVVKRMINTPDYESRSVSYLKELENSFITQKSLGSNRPSNNEVMIEDSTLLYVRQNSLYTGIVEVIPLAIKGDGQQGVGCRRLIDKSRTFLMHLDSLTYMTVFEIRDKTSHYTNMVKSYIANAIRSEDLYNEPQFSWEGN